MPGGLYRSEHAARTGDGEPSGAAVLDPVEPAGVTPEQEAGSTTASNSATMAIGSLVSRGTGFLRTLMLAAALGGGLVGNAYTTAQFLPMQIYELLLGGILSSVLVPVLVRRKKADADDGAAYTQKLLTVTTLGLLVVTALAVLAAPLFTALYATESNTAAYRGLVTALSYLIIPMIFFTGLSAMLGAVLNVRGHFAAPMWSPILNNLVVISTMGLFIVVFGGEEDLQPGDLTPGMIALVGGGTLLGVVAQLAGLLPALRKAGFAWRPRWDPRSLGLREIGALGGWMLCYVAANQVAVFAVVKLLNAASPSGEEPGLAIYNNVFLLIMMAHGIIGVSVMTALLPRMSAAAADGRLPDLVADLSRGLRTVTAALAPIVVAFAVLAAPIAVTLFQHGRFTAEQARDTATVLAVGAFAVLPLSISYLCTYTFYALQGTRTVALINLPVVLVRVGAQVALFVWLPDALAAAGLTAGNAISFVVSAAISLTILRRRIGRIGLREISGTLLKVLVAALGAAGAGLLTVHLLPGDGLPTFWEAVLQLAVGGAVVIGGYLGLAALLRIREVTQVISMVRRRLGR